MSKMKDALADVEQSLLDGITADQLELWLIETKKNPLSEPISDHAGIIAYVVFLVNHKWVHHFEDDATEILWRPGSLKNWPKPTRWEQMQMRNRDHEIMQLGEKYSEFAFELQMVVEDRINPTGAA